MNGIYREKKSSRELRRAGYASLQGYWGIAILAMLLATLLCASLTGGEIGVRAGFSSNVELDDEDIAAFDIDADGRITLEELSAGMQMVWEHLTDSLQQEQDLQEILSFVGTGVLLLMCLAVAVNTALYLLVGAPTSVGHHRLRLRILDRSEAKLGELFSGFSLCYWRSVGTRLLRDVCLFLWRLPVAILLSISVALSVLFAFATLASERLLWLDHITLRGVDIPWFVPLLALLFAIPFALLPLVAGYRYAMSDFILAENPDTSPADALRQSALMMKGNKWRLFCLRLSFIGWTILGMLTGGLLYIWMNPYLYQAEAAFYHEVSGRSAIRQAITDTKVYMEGL